MHTYRRLSRTPQGGRLPRALRSWAKVKPAKSTAVVRVSCIVDVCMMLN